MRISDWSSDVCSSDLLYRKGRLRPWNSPELLMLREPPERLPSRQDYRCDSKWSADETRNSPGASTFSSSTTPSFTTIAKRWPRAPITNLLPSIWRTTALAKSHLQSASLVTLPTLTASLTPSTESWSEGVCQFGNISV